MEFLSTVFLICCSGVLLLGLFCEFLGSNGAAPVAFIIASAIFIVPIIIVLSQDNNKNSNYPVNEKNNGIYIETTKTISSEKNINKLEIIKENIIIEH